MYTCIQKFVNVQQLQKCILRGLTFLVLHLSTFFDTDSYSLSSLHIVIFFAYYTYKPFWEGLTELNYTNAQFIIGAAKVVHKIVARRCFRHHPWLHRMALYLVLAFGDTILPVYLTLPALLTARYGSLVIHTYKNQWLELASTNSACKLAMELCIVEYSRYWIYTASCFLFITRQLIVLCECMLRRSYEGVECWISVKDSSITWYK